LIVNDTIWTATRARGRVLLHREPLNAEGLLFLSFAGRDQLWGGAPKVFPVGDSRRVLDGEGLGAIRQLAPGTRELPLPNARYADADLDPEQFIARPLTHRLAFSPDGRRALLWLELRGTVRKDNLSRELHDQLACLELWDLTEGKKLARWDRKRFSTARPAFRYSPDGKRVAVGWYGISIKDADTGREERRLTTYPVRDIVFSLDGKRILGYASDGASLFDLTSGQELRTWNANGDTWLSFALAAGDDPIASGSKDGSLSLWDVMTGRRLARWTAHKGSVTALAFHPDGQTLVSGGSDGVVKVWNLPFIRKELKALGLDWDG
jgi:WD40 repeat protein